MTITFVPLAESHFPLLLKWLETPHVKAWWDQDVHWTPDLIQEKFENYVKGYKSSKFRDQVIKKPTHAFIIVFDDTPIGYIQYYNKHDFPSEQGDETTELPLSCAGLDWYIGDYEFTGKGLGPKALSHFLESYVFPSFGSVFVDPDTANLAAIRAYEKAGFKLVKLVNKGTITWMLKEQPRGEIQQSPEITIQQLTQSDIPIIVAKFAEHHWPKPSSTFEKYLQEQQKSERLIWVAHVQNQFAGYITLKWQSNYQPFCQGKIPEIMDLNVLPPFQKVGIGSKLLEIAETAASEQSNVVGIGVGLYDGYGEAQKLYIKRGYIPDGRGITYNYEPIIPGSAVTLDDDLVLWFTKKI